MMYLSHFVEQKRRNKNPKSQKMAKGARSKVKKANKRIRNQIFAPKLEAQQNAITPDLEKCRENIAARDAEIQSKIEDQSMDDNNQAKDFDSKTRRNKDGNYAPWLSGKEKKVLQKANNKKKTQVKNKKKEAKKKLKKLANTSEGRKQIQEMKQQALENAMA